MIQINIFITAENSTDTNISIRAKDSTGGNICIVLVGKQYLYLSSNISVRTEGKIDTSISIILKKNLIPYA